MTSSHESSGRPAANRGRTGLVVMLAAILGDGTLDLAAGLAGADGSRDRVRSGTPVEAHSGDRTVMTVATAAGWRRKLWRGRDPRRPLEDVLQRPSLLDVHGEVCFGQLEREAGGRFLQRIANAFERLGCGVSRLLRAGQSCERRQHARQIERNRTHLISTIPVPVWPVEDSR